MPHQEDRFSADCGHDLIDGNPYVVKDLAKSYCREKAIVRDKYIEPKRTEGVCYETIVPAVAAAPVPTIEEYDFRAAGINLPVQVTIITMPFMVTITPFLQNIVPGSCNHIDRLQPRNL